VRHKGPAKRREKNPGIQPVLGCSQALVGWETNGRSGRSTFDDDVIGNAGAIMGYTSMAISGTD